MSRRPLIERYAKDIMRDPYYAWLERAQQLDQGRARCHGSLFSPRALPRLALTGGTSAEAAQFGLSLMVWGVVLRTVWCGTSPGRSIR